MIWTRAREAALSARPWDLERCRLKHRRVQEGAIAGSRLVGCSLREADFGGSDAQLVDFGHSDLRAAPSSSAPTCAGRAWSAPWATRSTRRENRVRGLRVEPLGASGLLAAMGLVVED